LINIENTQRITNRSCKSGTHTAEIAADTEYTTSNVGHTAAHIAQTAAYTGVILPNKHSAAHKDHA
jgi:hypothetical protein